MGHPENNNSALGDDCPNPYQTGMCCSSACPSPYDPCGPDACSVCPLPCDPYAPLPSVCDPYSPCGPCGPCPSLYDPCGPDLCSSVCPLPCDPNVPRTSSCDPCNSCGPRGSSPCCSPSCCPTSCVPYCCPSTPLPACSVKNDCRCGCGEENMEDRCKVKIEGSCDQWMKDMKGVIDKCNEMVAGGYLRETLELGSLELKFFCDELLKKKGNVGGTKKCEQPDSPKIRRIECCRPTCEPPEEKPEEKPVEKKPEVVPQKVYEKPKEKKIKRIGCDGDEPLKMNCAQMMLTGGCTIEDLMKVENDNPLQCFLNPTCHLKENYSNGCSQCTSRGAKGKLKVGFHSANAKGMPCPGCTVGGPTKGCQSCLSTNNGSVRAVGRSCSGCTR